jgi:3-oxoacyl-[acyl-carrier protein] reductase
MTSNRIALVTGASRGIGRAILLQLAEDGHAVVGTATTESGAASIDEYMISHGVSNGMGLVLNITDTDSVKSCLAKIKDGLGSPSILINNAAITQDNILLRMKESQWDQVIDTNLNSLYRLTKLALKPMARARWGRIINISSVVAMLGNVGQCNYAATKAGMIGFSKSLAREMASFGITVNCVSPGFVKTDMSDAVDEAVRNAMLAQIPMKRMADPKEIASVVSFLASELSSYITGENIQVNGGMLMN